MNRFIDKRLPQEQINANQPKNQLPVPATPPGSLEKTLPPEQPAAAEPTLPGQRVDPMSLLRISLSKAAELAQKKGTGQGLTSVFGSLEKQGVRPDNVSGNLTSRIVDFVQGQIGDPINDSLKNMGEILSGIESARAAEIRATEAAIDDARQQVEMAARLGGSDAVLALGPGILSKVVGAAGNVQAFAAALDGSEAKQLQEKLWEKGVALDINTIRSAQNGDSAAAGRIADAFAGAAAAGTVYGDYRVGTQTLGQVDLQSAQKFANNCVLFLRNARDVNGNPLVPDFPISGMLTYEDKLKTLANSGWIEIPYPVPGALVVEDTGGKGGGYGHIAQVNAVSGDRRNVTANEANFPGNNISITRNIAADGYPKTYFINPKQSDQGGFYPALAKLYNDFYQADPDGGVSISTVLSVAGIKDPEAKRQATEFLLKYAASSQYPYPPPNGGDGGFSSPFVNALKPEPKPVFPKKKSQEDEDNPYG